MGTPETRQLWLRDQPNINMLILAFTLSVQIFSLESPRYCSCQLCGTWPARRQESSPPAEDTDAAQWIVRQGVLMSSASGALSTEVWPCQCCWDTLCLIIPSVQAHTRAPNPALSISAFHTWDVLIIFQILAFASAITASKEGKWRGGMILTIGMGHAMESINGTARMNSIVLDFADSASYCSQKDIGVKQLIKEKGVGERGSVENHGTENIEA